MAEVGVVEIHTNSPSDAKRVFDLVKGLMKALPEVEAVYLVQGSTVHEAVES